MIAMGGMLGQTQQQNAQALQQAVQAIGGGVDGRMEEPEREGLSEARQVRLHRLQELELPVHSDRQGYAEPGTIVRGVGDAISSGGAAPACPQKHPPWWQGSYQARSWWQGASWWPKTR